MGNREIGKLRKILTMNLLSLINMTCTSKNRVAAAVAEDWRLLWWKFSERLKQQVAPKTSNIHFLFLSY